jgi:hypothetical protein
MKRYGLLLLAGALVALGASYADGPAPKDAKPAEAKDVDLVICLDVSNSMDGLISAAKQKLWDVVNTLARAKPAPKLRVALYSYGHTTYDASKGWVRKELDFGTDLDQVFKKLFDLTTQGGEEYVARVCRDAINDLKWSPKADALKMIFVCGNEPATQDPLVQLKEVAELAKKHGVIINPIYCGGPDDGDAQSWRELALLAKGAFATINQAQNVAIATPFDKKLADLAGAVNSTYLPIGRGGEEKLNFQVEQSENSKKLGDANIAARVVTQNGAFYSQAAWDIVDKCKQDKSFDVTKLKAEDLPEAMRKLTADQRVKYVQEMQKKRDDIQKQVDQLSRQRQEYLRDEQQRNAGDASRRLDSVLEKTLRDQAKTKQIVIPE